jgi:hypothetical protein
MIGLRIMRAPFAVIVMVEAKVLTDGRICMLRPLANFNNLPCEAALDCALGQVHDEGGFVGVAGQGQCAMHR